MIHPIYEPFFIKVFDVCYMKRTEGVNAGSILLFNKNGLSKCKFVLTIRKSEDLKVSYYRSLLKQTEVIT